MPEITLANTDIVVNKNIAVNSTLQHYTYTLITWFLCFKGLFGAFLSVEISASFSVEKEKKAQNIYWFPPAFIKL